MDPVECALWRIIECGIRYPVMVHEYGYYDLMAHPQCYESKSNWLLPAA